MNGLARSYLWYPGIDSDIEKLVGSCKICLSYRKTPPTVVVSDNGPQFASREFAQFLKLNGINQKLTPPYHPASNRCIERCIH